MYGSYDRDGGAGNQVDIRVDTDGPTVTESSVGTGYAGAVDARSFSDPFTVDLDVSPGATFFTNIALSTEAVSDHNSNGTKAQAFATVYLASISVTDGDQTLDPSTYSLTIDDANDPYNGSELGTGDPLADASVPEPATATLGLVGFSLLVMRRGRRRIA
jgi:hypothetical protein